MFEKMKKMLLIILFMFFGFVFSISVEAKSRNVTSKYRTQITQMLNELDGYLCFDIASPYDAEKVDTFLFDDYARTTMLCYRRYMGSEPGLTLNSLKRQCKRELRLFFGSTAKFKIKNYTEGGYEGIQNLYMIDNGKLRFCGGEYGDSFAAGKVRKIRQVTAKNLVVTYDEYLKHAMYEGIDYCGTYQISLKKSKNRYGFIITNIKRTKVG